MNSQRWSLGAGSVAVTCWIPVPLAFSQNLTDQAVENAARPLVEKSRRWAVDRLHRRQTPGNCALGKLGPVRETSRRHDSLRDRIGEQGLYESMLADAVVRGEIDLNAAADVRIRRGFVPSRDGRSIRWIDLSTHRSGLPRIPGNLGVTTLMDPYRDYDSKKAAEFLHEYELPRRPGDSKTTRISPCRCWDIWLQRRLANPINSCCGSESRTRLQMSDCTVDLSEDQRKRLATPHMSSVMPPRPGRFRICRAPAEFTPRSATCCVSHRLN